ncbi:uncharacterized protein LOC132940629 [Metopolophium dirhodum]|uniref:uncharacterized protein LOC132940629 n=1 Tax=Metopolophium dirhodum TaxID=44670 RepID=UPI0029904657|nr:uncharacterized protein LOC132940629 [Metopolophium dirhodum]
MSLNARPSGAQKRKAKNIRLAETNKLRRSLDKFCKIAKTTHVNTEENHNTATTSVKEIQLAFNDVLECTVENYSTDNELELQENVPENILVNLANDKTSIGVNLNSKYPTDRGNFPVDILSSDVKRLIVQYGPCKPVMEFPLDTNVIDDVVSKTHRNYAYFKYSWIEGINDWQHLSQKIAKHEKSIQHIEAVKLRTIWIKNQTKEHFEEMKEKEKKHVKVIF